MKKSIVTLVFITLVTGLFAQERTACKADMLAEKPGLVIQREYVNISKMDRLSIVVEYVTDLTNNKKLSALDFEYEIEGGGSVSTLLDPDEVDGLISFLQSLQDNISKAAAPKNYTEYTYQTLSGFEAGCYWQNAWKIYVKVDVNDSKTNIEFNKDDVIAFMSYLKQAKAKF